jgi:hypothetical protein
MTYGSKLLLGQPKRIYLVIDYRVALDGLRDYIVHAHPNTDVCEEDVNILFNQIIGDYFFEFGRPSACMVLTDFADLMVDYIEAKSPLVDLANELFEMIDEVTRYHWPRYNSLRPGQGIENATVRGQSVVVLEIDEGYLK